MQPGLLTSQPMCQHRFLAQDPERYEVQQAKTVQMLPHHARVCMQQQVPQRSVSLGELALFTTQGTAANAEEAAEQQLKALADRLTHLQVLLGYNFADLQLLTTATLQFGRTTKSEYRCTNQRLLSTCEEACEEMLHTAHRRCADQCKLSCSAPWETCTGVLLNAHSYYADYQVSLKSSIPASRRPQSPASRLLWGTPSWIS